MMLSVAGVSNIPRQLMPAATRKWSDRYHLLLSLNDTQDWLHNLLGPVQNENTEPMSKNQEFQDGGKRALNEAQGTSECSAPYDSKSHGHKTASSFMFKGEQSSTSVLKLISYFGILHGCFGVAKENSQSLL